MAPTGNSHAGYGVPESINHVLQHCFITDGAKQDQEDVSFRYLSGVLQCKGYQVEWEPRIRNTEGLGKFDLVATMASFDMVIDSYIVGDN